MKRSMFILFALCCLFVFCSGQQAADSGKMLLNKDWQLQSLAKIKASGELLSGADYSGGQWYETDVPATVLAALVENGVYPDPYYGLNLKSIPGFREGRWLAMLPESPFYPTWWYRKEFDLPADVAGKKLFLHLDGINYKANVWLNGRLIADSSQVIGMFRRFQFDISNTARPGARNALAVEISAPGKLPDIPYRTKQLEATTGWDDHNPQPPDLNMGIWRDVYIKATGPVELKNPYVVTDLDLPSLEVAHLKPSVEVTNHSDKPLKASVAGQIENNRFEREIELAAGETKEVVFSPEEFKSLSLKNPRLWWPHPVGPQNMYRAEFSVIVDGNVSDQLSVPFGIREVSTYINDEGWRGYKVNGKNILIRGGAWMTSDMLLRLTEKRYDALVRYARNANLNMLRSEGFSIRETDEFYDICDKYGIMVTQQIFGRSIPDEELAVSNVKDMILRIRNHPSLVHFLGHDETFPTPTLDAAYKELIARYTPERSYQPHSGAFEVEERFQTGGTRTGTLELWTYAPPNHYYTHKEDGAWGFAQSGGIGGIVAPLSSLKKMMPEEALWPLHNETFSFHTVLQSLRYFNALLDAIDMRYGTAKSLEDFSRKAQAINYECARGMFEAYGRNKYDALGITTWKYDAAWPASITWQYVDWYLNVGGAYYGAQAACRPLHIQYAYDDGSVWVVNNYYQDFKKLRAVATVYNVDLSKQLEKSVNVDVGADGKTKAFKIDWPQGLSKTHFLKLELYDESGKQLDDNFYWLSTEADIIEKKGVRRTEDNWWYFISEPKSVADFTALQDLPEANLEASFNIKKADNENLVALQLSNPSSSLAFMIHAAVVDNDSGEEVTPVFWDRNYVTLLPGESINLTGRFYPRDLSAQKAAIRVDGWNVRTLELK